MFQYRNHVNGQKKLQLETTKSLINVQDNNRSSGEESRSVATNCSHIPPVLTRDSVANKGVNEISR